MIRSVTSSQVTVTSSLDALAIGPTPPAPPCVPQLNLYPGGSGTKITRTLQAIARNPVRVPGYLPSGIQQPGFLTFSGSFMAVTCGFMYYGCGGAAPSGCGAVQSARVLPLRGRDLRFRTFTDEERPGSGRLRGNDTCNFQRAERSSR
jgi:hypothetical protein